MAPGREELAQGIPFVGGSGRIINRILRDVGIDPGTPRFINVVNCAPLGKGDKLTTEQIVACAPEFQAELMASKAEVIVVLGGDALMRVTGLKGPITRWRGHPLTPDDTTTPTYGKTRIPTTLPPTLRWIVPALHPSFIMRSGLKPLPFLYADIDRAKRALQDDLRLVVVEPQQPELLHIPLSVLRLAADVETVGLDFAARVTDIAIALQGPTGIESASWQWGGPVPIQAKAVLEDPRTTKVFHNGSYDTIVLRNEGIEVKGPLWDTMWAGQMVQPDLEKNLDTQSSLYLDVPRWKHLAKVDRTHYNRLDAHVTLALVDPIREALKESGQLELFEGTVMPALPTLVDMTWRGIRIDPKKRDELKRGLEGRVVEAQARFATLAGEVNPRSTPQLKKLLYETLDLPPQFKGEAITTEKSALAALMKKADGPALETLQALLDLRASSKLLSTYITDLNVVHPSYFPHNKDDDRYGTATGRLSSQNPNIQNQPKGMRGMYVPHREGNVLLAADYAQQEARIVAALAGDEALMQACREGIHDANMRALKCDKTRAKNAFYGWAYGAGPKKLMETLVGHGFPITQRECRELLDGLARAYPATARWRREVVRTAQETCYAVNAFGRRRYFYDVDSAVPEIINFHAQSNAADMLWKVMRDVEGVARAHGGVTLAFVHDEVLIEVEGAKLRSAAAALREVMERRFDEIAPGFVVPVSVKWGCNWGEMQDVAQAT